MPLPDILLQHYAGSLASFDNTVFYIAHLGFQDFTHNPLKIKVFTAFSQLFVACDKSIPEEFEEQVRYLILS